jgi:hypothetical protein
MINPIEQICQLKTLMPLMKFFSNAEHVLYAGKGKLEKIDNLCLPISTDDTDKENIFKLLHCDECIKKTGIRVFSQTDLDIAIDKAKNGLVKKDIIMFLKNCRKSIKKNEVIYILFC